MNGFVKTCGFIVIAGLMCLLLTACGGSGGKTHPGPIVLPTEQEQGVDIAATLAAPVPDGVEPELWEMLKAELVEELVRKNAAQEEEIEINWYPYTDGIGWSNAFMRPDGSCNGIVDIADLTPIAIHYGSEDHSYADYNDDGVVNIADIVEMARKFGLSCSGFRVEFSGTSEDSGFSVAGTYGYDDYEAREGNWRVYRIRCDTRESPLWVRVWALDNSGSEIGCQVFRVPLGGSSAPSGCCWPTILHTQPPTITWSTAYIIPDGNQDGVVDWFDAGFLTEFGGALISEQPLLTVADYDRDGRIWLPDITPFVMHLFESIGYFVIEVSAGSTMDEDFIADGTVDYFENVGFNEFGFRYYEYEIAAPPEVPTYWVRVVPYGINGVPGVPSNAIEMGGEI